jgi:hypothetical protein
MKKWTYLVLITLLFLSLAAPVWADNGQGQVAFPGGSIVVKPGDEIREDVAVLGGNLELREGGRISGTVTVLGGTASVDGLIGGDLVVLGGTLDLRSHAVIDGNLVTMGAGVSQAEGAVIRGERIEGFRGSVPRLSLPAITSFPWSYARTGQGKAIFDWFLGTLNTLLNTLAMMVLGVLLVFFVPKQTHLVGQTATQAPLATLGVGLLTILALPVLLIILVLICVGIPVAILLAMLAVAASLFGWIAIAVIIGERMLAGLKARPVALLEVVVGVGLLALLTAVPCLGWLLWMTAACMGLGAVVLTRFGTMTYQPRRPAAWAPESVAPPDSAQPISVDDSQAEAPAVHMSGVDGSGSSSKEPQPEESDASLNLSRPPPETGTEGDKPQG